MSPTASTESNSGKVLKPLVLSRCREARWWPGGKLWGIGTIQRMEALSSTEATMDNPEPSQTPIAARCWGVEGATTIRLGGAAYKHAVPE